MRIDRPGVADPVASAAEQGTATPLASSAVTRGSVRILSEQGFYVGGDASAFVDGLLKVLGRLELTGDFILSGDTDASGEWTQSGAFNLTGPFTLTGDTIATGSFRLTGPFTVEGNTSMTGTFTSTGEFTLTGPFHINGATDLNGTMTVHPSGQIVIEGSTPLTIANGAITAGGAQLEFVSGLGMVMSQGSSQVQVGTFGAGLQAGSKTVFVSILGGMTVNAPSNLNDNVTIAGGKYLAAYGDVYALATTFMTGDVYMTNLPPKP